MLIIFEVCSNRGNHNGSLGNRLIISLITASLKTLVFKKITLSQETITYNKYYIEKNFESFYCEKKLFL